MIKVLFVCHGRIWFVRGIFSEINAFEEFEDLVYPTFTPKGEDAILVEDRIE